MKPKTPVNRTVNPPTSPHLSGQSPDVLPAKQGGIIRILAIESSCDETACAIVEKYPGEDVARVIASVTATSLAKHKATKGIVPEVAAREQLKVILPVIEETMRKTSEAQSHKAAEQQKKHDSKSAGLRVGNDTPISNIQSLISNLDYIAVTTGPGLIGSLLVGIETARSLAYAWNLPIIPVNHIEAHPYANFIETETFGESVETQHAAELQQTNRQLKKIPSRQAPNSRFAVRDDKSDLNSLSLSSTSPTFPLLSWVISGGHTELYLMRSHDEIIRLGGTVDDAAGECFDKCARLLGYDYPGGPFIEKLASQLTTDHRPLTTIKLPRPMIHDDTFNMSFSGLKSAFVREYEKMHAVRASFRPDRPYLSAQSPDVLPAEQGGDIALAWELQEAISDVIVAKTKKALEKYPDITSIIVSGGVAANSRIREKLKTLEFPYRQARNTRFAVRDDKSDLNSLSLSSTDQPSNRPTKQLQTFFPPLTYCTDNAAMIGAWAAFHPDKATSWENITVKLK